MSELYLGATCGHGYPTGQCLACENAELRKQLEQANDAADSYERRLGASYNERMRLRAQLEQAEVRCRELELKLGSIC